MDVVRVGVVITPTVMAHRRPRPPVDLGVMISILAQPYADNGIKFFAHGGYKLPDQVEDPDSRASEHFVGSSDRLLSARSNTRR